MKVVKHVLLTVAVTTALALYSPAWAADDAAQDKDRASVQTQTDEELETLTVIATKTPKAPLDSPASVSVISEKEIKAFNSEHPFKPLLRTEGIYPRQYRGLADYWSRPMIRGNRALVMVDGLNWYDYGQYYSTSAIPMTDIETIEIVRGPFSALYGTLAQTGVINYVTKIPYETQAETSFTYGTDNTQFYKARLADRPFRAADGAEQLSWAEKNLGDKFFYSMSFKYRTTDGYETNPTYLSLSSSKIVTGDLDSSIPIATDVSTDINPKNGATRYIIGTDGKNWYDDYGAFLKTGYEFSDYSKIWYSFNINQFEYGWSGGHSCLTDADGNAITSGNYYIQDGSDTYLYSISNGTFTPTSYQKESYVHTLHYDYSVPHKVDVNALIGYNDKETQSYSVASAYTKEEDNNLLQADLSATFHMMNDQFLLTIGTQGVKENATVTKYNLSDASDSDSWASVATRESGESLTWGTFVQAEYTPIQSTTLYLGGRYDHWWATDSEYSDIAGNHETAEDKDDGQFSPKASLVYRLLDNGILRGSYGKSFTAPCLYYRIASYSYEIAGTKTYATGNPDLEPTTNESWELGTEWLFLNKKLRLKATYFQNDFEDLIANATSTYVIDGQSVSIKKRTNVASAEVDGIELGVEVALPWNLKSGIHYTHHWSDYDDPNNALGSSGQDGWEVDEVPTDIFNFWLGYFAEHWEASVNVRYSDSAYDDRRDSYAGDTFDDYSDSFVVDAQLTYRPNQKIALTLSVDNLFDDDYYEYYEAPGRTVMGTISISL
ncbi:TonB-dependent receptor [uncultured Desulfobacter sp.]|uniref:TonB-dependent receptor n=1 Tax=uncultured Desulfobacter sp. TaxID=240139 RepID=UPI002AAC15D0|nr:TonB-dependent receptor [uncultured Desulfobacter sp.]